MLHFILPSNNTGESKMATTGKKWTWKEDAAGRKAASEAMTARLLAGKVGRSFERKHGMGGTPTYNSWKHMMARCYKPENQDYHNYGGRGITVCEAWHDPRVFLADMGEKRDGFSIERIDVNLGYFKDNCYWLPMRLQARNRRPWKHTPEGLEKIRAARRKQKE
jgi:hypothetical protein